MERFTSDFLQKILRNTESDDSIAVISNTAENATEKGDNYASSMKRITVLFTRHGESKSKEISLIIKLVTENEGMGAIVLNSTAFPREIRMLNEMLPNMHALLEGEAPGRYQTFGAKCYYSKNKPPYVLIMEDLSVKGFKLADRSRGVDLAHSFLIMENLARFHATGLILYKQNPENFNLFSKSFFIEGKAIDDFTVTFATTQFKTIALEAEKWPEDGARLAQKLRDRSKTIMEDFREAQITNPNDFNVLVHGDFWVNNMMFRYNDVTGNVEDVKFVDFQLCSYLSFANDLQLFIYSSVSDDVRENYEKVLLKVYHAELCKTFTLLGHEDKIITFDRLWEQYERKSVLGFFWSVCALSIILTDRGKGHDFEEMLKEKESLPVENELTEECKKVFKRLLPIFEKKGLF